MNSLQHCQQKRLNSQKGTNLSCSGLNLLLCSPLAPSGHDLEGERKLDAEGVSSYHRFGWPFPHPISLAFCSPEAVDIAFSVNGEL